jgi:hypothetical protein
MPLVESIVGEASGRLPDELIARRGTFTIPSDEVRYRATGLLPLMAQMVVVRCEHEFMTNWFVYHAYSPLFDEVDAAYETPRYDIVFDTSADGKRSYRAIRRKA